MVQPTQTEMAFVIGAHKGPLDQTLIDGITEYKGQLLDRDASGDFDRLFIQVPWDQVTEISGHLDLQPDTVAAFGGQSPAGDYWTRYKQVLQQTAVG